MYQSDWVLRQIEMLSELLRRMLSALREQRPGEAVDLARDALSEIGQIDPAVLDALTPDGLGTFLGAGGRIDPAVASLVGEVLLARADARKALGDPDAASMDRARAVAVLSRADDSGDADEASRIASLLAAATEEE